jgi:hypothetical protein
MAKRRDLRNAQFSSGLEEQQQNNPHKLDLPFDMSTERHHSIEDR